MENKEQTQEKTKLELLEGIISNASSEIEREFQKTANNWLACFGTIVFQIETILHSRQIKEGMPDEKFKKAVEKLEFLKQQLQELKTQYSEKETMPPDEIKLRLLENLKILE